MGFRSQREDREDGWKHALVGLGTGSLVLVVFSALNLAPIGAFLFPIVVVGLSVYRAEASERKAIREYVNARYEEAEIYLADREKEAERASNQPGSVGQFTVEQRGDDSVEDPDS